MLTWLLSRLALALLAGAFTALVLGHLAGVVLR